MARHVWTEDLKQSSELSQSSSLKGGREMLVTLTGVQTWSGSRELSPAVDAIKIRRG